VICEKFMSYLTLLNISDNRMNRKYLLLIYALILCEFCSAQELKLSLDSLTAEQYSTFMSDYYTEKLTLNNWQHQQTYTVILQEKQKLDSLLASNKTADKNKLLKKYYRTLEGKFGYIFSHDQYEEYKHMNTVPIKTVEVQ